MYYMKMNLNQCAKKNVFETKAIPYQLFPYNKKYIHKTFRVVALVAMSPILRFLAWQ